MYFFVGVGAGGTHGDCLRFTELHEIKLQCQLYVTIFKRGNKESENQGTGNRKIANIGESLKREISGIRSLNGGILGNPLFCAIAVLSKSTNFGILQGSILGPTIFNLYVADLSDILLTTKSVQYADDTTFA